MPKDKDALVDEFKKVLDGFTSDFEDFLAERCDQAALQWLRVYGMPQTPNEVWSIFYATYRGVPALLVQEKKMVPTEGVSRDGEEREKRTAERQEEEEAMKEQARASFQQLFDPDTVNNDTGIDSAGGYL